MKKSFFLITLFLFLKHNSFCQDWEWAKRAGSINNVPYPLQQLDASYSCAVDKLGHCYITGMIYSPNQTDTVADFDQWVIQAKTPPTLYLAKYNNNGNVEWVKTVTNAVGRAVAVDSQNNVYITGKFGSQTVFEQNQILKSLGSSDVFLAKYTPEGQCSWAIKGGTTSGEDEGLSIAIDIRNRIYVTGKVGQGSGNFEHTPLKVNIPNNEGGDLHVAFLAQADPSGYWEWAKPTVVEGSCAYSTGYSIDTDGLGNIYIAGIYSGGCSFSNTIKLISTLNDEDVDGFVAKYSSTGQAIWAKKIGSPQAGSSQVTQALIVDKKNNIYITGHYLSGITIGNITFPSKPSQAADAYLAKLNSNGSVLWAKNIGNPVDHENFNTYGWSLALSDSDAVYLAGEFTHEVKFDANNSLIHPDFVTPKLFLVRYNSDATFGWSSYIEKQGDAYPWGLANFIEENKENLFITGEFHNFMILGNYFLQTIGDGDIFLAKGVVKKY
ncbi:MAG: hypothetical protein K1X66_09640 [Verrucomicrobiae bacterium]|nr:hypothetical protein [Verrucomicrobiae bacterium]